MNFTRCLTAGILLLLLMSPAHGGTLTGPTLLDSGLETKSLERLSVGVDVEVIQRDIQPDPGGVTELEARQVSGFLGLDVLPWLAIFGTVGRVEAKIGQAPDFAHSDTKWSGGLSANLWHWDEAAKNPGWGLTLKLVGEYSEYQAGEGTDTIEWNEVSVALPLSYDIYFSNYPADWTEIATLMLYAGPAYSSIDGTRTMGGATYDFEQVEDVGLVGGADLFLSDSFSIRGQVQSFDGWIYSLSLRYHFH